MYQELWVDGLSPGVVERDPTPHTSSNASLNTCPYSEFLVSLLLFPLLTSSMSYRSWWSSCSACLTSASVTASTSVHSQLLFLFLAEVCLGRWLYGCIITR